MKTRQGNRTQRRSNAADISASGVFASADSEDLARAHGRLQRLYEISQLLARFESVSSTVPAVIALVRQKLELENAILILETPGQARSFIWEREDGWAHRLSSAKERARTSYGYLVGAAAALVDLDEDQTGTRGMTAPTSANPKKFIMLPLAVEPRRIFGALQLEATERFDEMDLVFVNAVVNLLAVSLDRHLVIEQRQAHAEAGRLDAEERQLLAEARQARAERKGARSEAERAEIEAKKNAAEVKGAISERKLATAEAIQERYEGLVDNIDHAFVWEADARTFQVAYVSARAQTLLGFTRARWLDERDFWMTHVHPDDREGVEQTFRLAVREKKDQRCEHRVLTREGGIIWLHTGVHFAGAEDPARQLQGVSLNITPAKEAEEKVLRQLDFTRAVTGSLGEGVLALDLDGRITLFNAAAAEMLGWQEEEALGKLVWDIVEIRRPDGTPIAAEEDPFRLVMREGGPLWRDEQLFVGKNGTAFPVSHTVTALPSAGRISGAVIAFKDITLRKQAEDALRDAVDKARSATRAREELLALVSHDLKNPLGIILLSISLMSMTSAGTDRRRSRKQLDSIKRAAERMNHLIDDLLDTASIDAGTLSIELVQLPVRPLVGDAIDAMQISAASKSLHIECELPDSLPPVLADVGRLQQVFANLLTNAVKFTPSGGKIYVRAELSGDAVQFSVRDTGAGIAEGDLPHLFERFWQAPRTARQGTGLGLSIVQAIVGGHGGRIWVESVLGAGSTFFFTLPVAPSDTNATAELERAQLAQRAAILQAHVERQAFKQQAAALFKLGAVAAPGTDADSDENSLS